MHRSPRTSFPASLAAGLAVLALLTSGRAIAQGTPPNLLGTWEWSDEIYPLTLTLNPDGTGILDEEPIRYTVAPGMLTIFEEGEAIEYEFTLAGDKLTLSGGDLDETTVFVRQGGDSGSGDAATLVGNWEVRDESGTYRLALNPDGTGVFDGMPLRWKLDRSALNVEKNETHVTYAVKIDPQSFTISGGDLAAPATFQRRPAAGAGAGAPPAAEGPAAQVAGVWVGEESSLDPQFYMSFTQYVTLYADGTVGYQKAEGGASRVQVTEALERFSSFQMGPTGGAGGDFGRWETDGVNVTVYWNRWNNLVSSGSVDLGSGALTLSGMGALDEGAALTFKREQ